MSVFFTDLDNTLIFSHRRNIGEEKTAVEYLEGREQSFMTDYAYSFLQGASWLDIVPVTTRTHEQLRRLSFLLKDLNITLTIACNGGMLLIDGEEDEAWSAETISLAGKQICAIDRAFDKLLALYPDVVIHRPAPYMIYFKSSDPALECRKIGKTTKDNEIVIQHDSRKVYLFAASVNKGNAIVRLKKRMQIEVDTAAGDSEMDVQMLNAATYALVSDRISHMIQNDNKIVLEDETFSDRICDALNMLHTEGGI